MKKDENILLEKYSKEGNNDRETAAVAFFILVLHDIY